MNSREEFMPLPAGFWQRVRPGDAFIVSYPRSGSRWLRWAITDLVSQSQGRDMDVFLDHMLRLESETASAAASRENDGLLVENAYHPTGNSAWMRDAGLPAIYRCHTYKPIFSRGGYRTVYLFREYASLMVSYWCYARSNGNGGDDTSAEQFALRRVQEWQDHVSGALEAARRCADEVLVLEYGDGFLSTEQLLACAHHLRIPASERAATAALARIGALFSHLNGDDGCLHGRGRNEPDLDRWYSPKALRKIEAKTRPVFEEAVSFAAKALADRSPGRSGSPG